jgi:hypothetical protein
LKFSLPSAKKTLGKKALCRVSKKTLGNAECFFLTLPSVQKKTLGKEPDSGSDCDLYSQFMRICLFYWLVLKKCVLDALWPVVGFLLNEKILMPQCMIRACPSHRALGRCI